jgi:YbbR domain-containing protein
MLRSLRENLSLKLIAVATSIVIWVFVATTKTQPEIRRDTTAEVQSIGSAPGDLIVTLHNDPVQVEVVGPKSQVDSIDPGAIKALVELGTARLNSSGLRIASYSRPPAAPDVTVRALRPLVAADVTPKRRKRLPIDTSFTNDPPPGMRFGPPRLAPTWADVVGAEAEVRRVARLVVYIETSGGAVRAEVPIKPLDRSGVLIDSVQVDPIATKADVSLLDAPASKTLIVSVDHTGRPPSMYEVRDILVDPPRVTVMGSAAVLQTLTSIPTEELTLDGLKTDTVRDVALQLPAGVTVRSGTDRVRVTLKVREIPRTGP